MGYRSPNLDAAYSVIRSCLVEVSSPYNDGWTSGYCKRELYLLKCWLDEQYKLLPPISGEDEWEKERLIKILKKSNQR